MSRARHEGGIESRAPVREVAAALSRSDLFGSLAPSVIRRLAAAFDVYELPGGRTLFRQGQRGDAAYVVAAGRLRALADSPAGAVHIGEIGPGEIVGEQALLARCTRTATVHAIRDSRVLRLSGEAFMSVIRHHPQLMLRVAEVVAHRAASTRGPAVRAPVRTIAVVAAGTAAVRLDDFAEQLVDALRRHGRARIVTEASAVRGTRSARAAEPQVLSWLQNVEKRHRFVVYLSDPGPSAWTLRCLRQADLVLLVGRGGGDPELSPAERALRTPTSITHARAQLVLLWPSGHPQGTLGWLRHRDPECHHHVTGPRDYARLARWIAGRAVGLVLGGGGARGLAHVGVMRAIDEAGIPVDAVGGTSIGAIVGASHALDWDDATRTSKAIDGFVRTRMLVGPTLPIVSFSSARKVTRLLSDPRFYGDTLIEDMPRRFFCVSANLSTEEMVVHETGLLWWACRASASLPGILPPVHRDGDVLVDGGVVNNLPVRPMRDRLEGIVIACDIEPEVDLRVREAWDPTLSGWRVLARKLHPFAASMEVPSALEVIMRAKEVGGRRAQREDLDEAPPDLMLRPPTERIGSLDFRAGRALIEIGYSYAAEQLASSPLTKTLTA